MSGLSAAGLATLDVFWSKRFGCLPAEVDSKFGIALGPDYGREYIHLLQRGEGLRVSCSPAMLPFVMAASEGHTPLALFDPTFFTSALAPYVETLIGPTFLGYLDELEPSADGHVRTITPTDSANLKDLQASVSETEWEHSGLGHNHVAVGYFRDGRLISAAGFDVQDQVIAHVGVLTRPDVRGSGLGKRCVRAITNQAVERGLVAQYQTLHSNLESISVARTLGFIHYADRMFVRAKAT